MSSVLDACVLLLPPAFDPWTYRERYSKLRRLRRSELRLHWQQQGRRDGDNASAVATWANLLQCLKPCRSVLEIGPFDRPAVEFLRGPGVVIDYADYLDTAELMARARTIPERNPDTVPPIRYVLSNGGYGQIKSQYDAVVSQHCLEHQPDLVAHLQQVAGVLNPHGIYLCSIPDRRRCFDRHLAPTGLVNVLAAHLEGRTKPSLESILEHRCFTVSDWHNAPDPAVALPVNLRDRLEQACSEYRANPYVDVHCWKFTSESLRHLIKSLVALGYLPATTSVRFYNLGNEFAMALAFSSEARPAFTGGK